MDSYHIWGGKRLSGTVCVSGAKNAVLPILAATAMIPGETVIENCPDLADVHKMCEILSHLGCSANREGSQLRIDSGKLHKCGIPEPMMKSLRSSVFLAGPLLARCGQAILSSPGGCAIGSRPIDLHFMGLSALGATVREKGNRLFCRGGKLVGNEIHLTYPSVGATENILMAAATAQGTTVIRNGAREPEIVDLQNFLNCCGAQISGAGTGEICIQGVTALHPTNYRVMGDRIEGGTYLMAAAATGGEITVTGLSPSWLKTELETLRNMGCQIQEGEEEIRLKAPQRLKPAGSVKAEPYPGFPTDLQSQLMALCTVADGKSRIEDTVFESRFQCAAGMRSMGAEIEISGRSASICGCPRLRGNRVSATDLRGGAALVIAALAAQGKTIVENICHIDRGYGKFDIVLKQLGANIERREDDERETTGISKEQEAEEEAKEKALSSEIYTAGGLRYRPVFSSDFAPVRYTADRRDG